MAKKYKKKRKKKVNQKYLDLKNKLRVKKNPKDSIRLFKLTYPYNELRAHLKNLSKEIAYKKYIVGNPFPRRINELKQTPPLIYSNLDRELYWSALVIKLFINEINSFLPLKLEFEYNFLTGQYDKALVILENVEKKFGYSIWLIENNISLLQELYGLEKQKEYYRGISDDNSVSGIIRYLSYLHSMRAEPNLSFIRYEEMVKIAVEGPAFLDEFTQYLSYKANCFGSDIIQNYPSILYYESTSSIFDRYLTL